MFERGRIVRLVHCSDCRCVRNRDRKRKAAVQFNLFSEKAESLQQSISLSRKKCAQLTSLVWVQSAYESSESWRFDVAYSALHSVYLI